MYGYGQQYPPIRSRVFNWILFVGKIVHLVGMLSPYWTVDTTALGDVHAGIWLVCSSFGGCGSVYDDVLVISAYLRAVQALAILAVLVSLFGMICIIIFLRTGNRTLLTPGAVAATAAGVMVIIAVIIYGVKNSVGLAWAFYLEAVSGVFMLVAGAGQFSQIFARSQ